MDFDKILNWKLLTGSHDFPGAEGGTCINEAAIVAAGFAYQSVTSVKFMPECFSRPISSLAMMLNDYLPDDLRQNLIKYVYQLAGTADDIEVEQARTKKIKKMLITGMTKIVSDITNKDMKIFCDEWLQVLSDEPPRSIQHLFGELMVELDSLQGFIISKDNPIMMDIDEIVQNLAQLGFDTLDAALAIGNHGDLLETKTIKSRMDEAKKKSISSANALV